jgi:integrase
MKVIQGALQERRPTPIEEAYAHFRLDRQGMPVSAGTLRLYEHTVGRFLRWLRQQHPEVRRFEDLDVVVVREYRAELAARPGLRGKQIQRDTERRGSGHADLLPLGFGRRLSSGATHPAARQGESALEGAHPLHVVQLREILAACNPAVPQEALAVRILIGSGVRRAELCGLAIEGPDGLSDLMLDSLDRGIVELRVRGEAGAKEMRARRVPIVPKLGGEIKRYTARHRPEVGYPNLLINRRGRPYQVWGVDEMMDRLGERTGFRVHAHAFRHTFATVATKLGWNFERLRAAMGHEDYTTLQRYVRLAMERDLGPLVPGVAGRC